MPITNVTAPSGAHFESDEVATKRGEESLGEVPILVWDSVEAANAYYGEEAILSVLDGTSLRVSFQGIARRSKQQGKSNDDIAKMQVDFRPGQRVGGQSTPTSRVRRKAETAAEKVDAAQLEALLDKINSGELDIANLVGAA